jgi:hypothetical protein
VIVDDDDVVTDNDDVVVDDGDVVVDDGDVVVDDEDVIDDCTRISLSIVKQTQSDETAFLFQISFNFN